MAGQGLSWLCLSPEPPGLERMGGWKEAKQLPGLEDIRDLNCCQLETLHFLLLFEY